MATTDKDHVFVAEAIRVDTLVTSGISNTGEFTAETIVVHNGLNQTVTIQLQGSVDETTWLDMGESFNVSATSNDFATVSDYFPWYQITAICSTAPTTGTMDVWILKAGAVT